MKAKIERNGVYYQHIPHVGKTIATLEGCEDNFDNLIWKLVLNNSNFLGYVPLQKGNLIPLKNQYRAISKTNVTDGDVYNKVTGEEVAYEKVMKKYHKHLDNNMRVFLEDVRNLAAGVEHYLDKKGVTYDSVPNVEEIKVKRFTGKTN